MDSAGGLAVRRYQDRDRDALLAIAADTAWFGEPVECYLDDRRLFLDLMYRDYVDHETELAWVATTDGGAVCGFVVGAPDTRRHRERHRRTRRRVLLRLLGGRYRIGAKTARAVWARHGARAEPSVTVDLERFPAHLHVNMAAEARGRGAGRALLGAFLGGLRERGVPGVHLTTTDANVVACRLYERLGFHLLDAVRREVWPLPVGRPLELRAYGLELAR